MSYSSCGVSTDRSGMPLMLRPVSQPTLRPMGVCVDELSRGSLRERRRLSRSASREPLVGIVGWPQDTNERLAEAWQDFGIRAAVLIPFEARALLCVGDVAVGRFDVLPTLDGVQPGTCVLDALSLGGVRVVNGRASLLNAHDKLQTARLLASAALPHPRTWHVTTPRQVEDLELPLVLKPRFGSWGADVFRCETADSLARTLGLLQSRPWFVRHGALAQELIPTHGFDLRLVVAGGQVVGATERVARRGEWRTNVSLGGTRRTAHPTSEAKALAIAAAGIIGAGLVGIDLLPVENGHVVLELNGAVEFDRAYDLDGVDVFRATATALRLSSGSSVAHALGREHASSASSRST